MPNRDVYSNKPITIRNFSGGWNVADSEHNLASKYQVVSDNVFVGVNGAIQPRYGYRLLHDLKQGEETQHDVTVSFATTLNQPYVTITWPSPPTFLFNGNHITFRSPVTITGMTEPLFGTYGVYQRSGSTFRIQARTAATGAATTSDVSISVVTDNHLLGGNVIEDAYFQDHIILFSDIGEIIKISEKNIATRIWDVMIAQALSGNPIGWRGGINGTPLTSISYDTWRQTLIVVNGRLHDKPIEIDLTKSPNVQFLVDPATASNTYVYPADFVQSFGSYILMYASNNPNAGLNLTPTLVDLSAKNTSGVFVGNPDPDDATQIDLGRLTNTIDPLIQGVGTIRNQVFVGFYDSGMLGKVGIYNSANIHEPDFNDQVPQHGTLNNRVIVNIGNDLLMCDYAGVPAFALSQTSGVIVPSRMSQLIDPELNKHLARLSPKTTKEKVFAVYNIRERQYMLSVPKFDENSVQTDILNPFFSAAEQEGTRNLVVACPAHGFSEGDYLDITGATDVGPIPSSAINGRRKIVGAIDEDYFIIEIDYVIGGESYNGGGTVTFTPVNDENIMYVFLYNQEMRIKRWTRYRGLKFKAATVSKDGKLFFCTDSKVYRMGTGASPLYADAMEDYDERVWSAGKSYPSGYRVRDGATVYISQQAHVSAGDSFAEARAANPLLWEVFRGFAIKWSVESPWSDYSDRMALKVNSHLQLDVQGAGRLTFQMYVDNIYRDALTLARTPAASVDFVGGGAGGFGRGPQSYGGGRRTKEQKIFNFPFRAKIAKFRMTGESKERLEINAISMMYQKGSVYR